MAIDAVLIGARGTSSANTVTTTSGTSTGGTGNIGVIFCSFDPSVTHNTPTDSKSNTWTQVGTVYTGGFADLVIYQCENWTGGASHTATMTFSGTAYPTLHLVEVTGAASSSALDINVTGTASIAGGGSGGIASGTLAQAAEVLLAFAEMNDGSDGSYTSSNTTVLSQEPTLSSFWTSAVSKLVVNATTSVTPTWARTGNSSNTFGFRIVSFKESAGSGYTVTGAQGSYSLTGQTVNLLTSHNPITAAQGSYALTGQVVGLTYGAVGGYSIIAEQGSYTVVGSNALIDVSMNADFGSYTLTGQTVTLTYLGLTNRTLVADQGSYALTGQDTGLLLNEKIFADQGAYTLTGRSVGLYWSGAPQGSGYICQKMSLSSLGIGL